VCERVCTSDRLLKKLGSLAKVCVCAPPGWRCPARRAAAAATAEWCQQCVAVLLRAADARALLKQLTRAAAGAGMHACFRSRRATPASPCAACQVSECVPAAVVAMNGCGRRCQPHHTLAVHVTRPPAASPPAPCVAWRQAAPDACTDACQRAVCSIPHQVPAWNDSCLKRCTAECLKGRAS
jgi:hypothetical protein